MIDIHSHLLPGIDDGAANVEQSLALARHAVSDGITHMVLTPHIQPGTYENDRASITLAFDLLQAALDQHQIPLHIAMAAEVRICPEILPMVGCGDIPMMLSASGQKTLLLELPHSHIPPGSDKMVQWLLNQGIQCLIAHPERNKELMVDIDKLAPLMQMGCKLQLTAGSVAGRFGETSQRIAFDLLQRGWVSVLATDAHNLRHRPPDLSPGRKASASVLGEIAARDLVCDGPWALVGGLFADI